MSRRKGRSLRFSLCFLGSLFSIPVWPPRPSLPPLPFSLTKTSWRERSQSRVFQKPLISGQISCNLSSTAHPLIWLILGALDKRERIPEGCRNAAAHWRQPSLAPFNLFGGGDTVSLWGRPALCSCDTAYFDRARDQCWKQEMVSGCIQSRSSSGDNGLRGRHTHRLGFCLACSAAADGPDLTCSAGVYGFSSHTRMSHCKVSGQRQALDTLWLLYLSPPTDEYPESF